MFKVTIALGCYPLYTFINALALRIQLLTAVGVSFVHPAFFFFCNSGYGAICFLAHL